MRNNEKRLGLGGDGAPPEDAAAPAQQSSALDFVVPTEFVELPSQGKFYSEDHPLRDQEVVEIKFMTTKQEDILTSPALIKRGLAIDRLIDSLFVDSRLKSQNLLSGDRNAILIAARKSGYGSAYVTDVSCPSCGSLGEHVFDLEEVSTTAKCLDEAYLSEKNAQYDKEKGLLNLTLPKTKAVVGLKLMTGRDEAHLFSMSKKKVKSLVETSVTDHLIVVIKTVNGQADKFLIGRFVESLPISDSRYLRDTYSELVPTVDLTQDYSCAVCGHIDEMEVPFNTEFFWPK